MLRYSISSLSKNSIIFTFDLESADEFIDELKSLLNEKQHCSFDIEEIKEHSASNKKIKITKIEGDYEIINIEFNSIELQINQESIEYAIHKLTDYKKNGLFFPSEYISVANEKTRKNMQLYFYQ